ncbi:plasmid mobilization relaxosome protein MobC [Pedobacter sp. ISL-68]|uniref:plasmid mobilization protein n=1 Tax=unclassified Pedobacter TaxID=2628915 RepID=UPI001BE8E20E|nr:MULTISPECIES: plasmid mobilization relaxosome protein MobC [unclassified Pedobacter]MBT2564692.1 plasmid mobilization relaxosome protein MobC [Pedobacter sp. ISL-64]MBT2592419.1 plasmid mobilization relaxosome protein MobC [Pedobacter sp. ISL-68]
MERKNLNRTRIIGLRLTPEEYAKIERRWKDSICRKLSDYVRHNLFEKPVVSSYRSQSTDDFMAEMAQLRTELNHIGNNFNQAVKRLHTLNQIAEFRSWLIAYEVEKKTLFNKVDEVKKHIQKIAESWLQ